MSELGALMLAEFGALILVVLTTKTARLRAGTKVTAYDILVLVTGVVALFLMIGIGVIMAVSVVAGIMELWGIK